MLRPCAATHVKELVYAGPDQTYEQRVRTACSAVVVCAPRPAVIADHAGRDPVGMMADGVSLLALRATDPVHAHQAVDLYSGGVHVTTD